MGKKGGINEVLAKGKALHKAMKENPPAEELPEEYRVPLTAKLPGGITLQGFMKRNSLTYKEACKVYHAYTSYAEEELSKESEGKKRGKSKAGTASVEKEKKNKKAATTAAKKRKQEEQEEEQDEEQDAEQDEEQDEEQEEEPPASKKSNKRASSAAAKASPKSKTKKGKKERDAKEEDDSKPEPDSSRRSVRRKLTFAAAFSSDEEGVPEDPEVAPASPKLARRVSHKRALTDSEKKVFPEAPSRDMGSKKISWAEPLALPAPKILRKNASEDVEKLSESNPTPGLSRKWSLGFNNLLWHVLTA